MVLDPARQRAGFSLLIGHSAVGRGSSMRLGDTVLKQLFLEARTHRAWLPKEVPDSLLTELVDIMKMGPTSYNCLPARIIFVKSKAAKERLKPHLTPSNVD